MKRYEYDDRRTTIRRYTVEYNDRTHVVGTRLHCGEFSRVFRGKLDGKKSFSSRIIGMGLTAW